MVGVITTRHLVTNARVIVAEFGLRCYLRCWRRVASGKPVTFLEVVCSIQTKE